MIAEYLEAAMKKAKYEYIPDERTYFGKIPGFKGLWTSGQNKRLCEKELRERLDEWIVLSLRMNLTLPVTKGLSLNCVLPEVKEELAQNRPSDAFIAKLDRIDSEIKQHPELLISLEDAEKELASESQK